jgi:thiamine-phosphate pyrophosphorylase
VKIAVITSAVRFDGEAQLINELFDSGMDLLHLRKPNLEKMEYSLLLGQIEVKYHHQIVLHAYHELAADFGIRRLHYPEFLRKNQQRGILREKHPDKVLSTSIHSLDEIDLVQEFDYAFIGPIFDSYSKPDYQGIGIENLQLPQKTNTQLFALGGIDINNINSLKLLGFDGVGLLGWLWNNLANAVANFKQIKCQLKENM